MNLETKYQDLSILVRQYNQEPQCLKNRYQHLESNVMNFDCTKITNKNVSAHLEEKQSLNEDNECKNCERKTIKINNSERNASENNKSAGKNTSKRNNKNTTWGQ